MREAAQGRAQDTIAALTPAERLYYTLAIVERQLQDFSPKSAVNVLQQIVSDNSMPLDTRAVLTQKLADIYATEWNNHLMAAQIYIDFCAAAPPEEVPGILCAKAGLHLMKAGKYHDALNQLNKLLDYNLDIATRSISLFSKGICHMEEREDSAAKEAWEQLILERPQTDLAAKAYFFMGSLSLSNGEYQEAQSHFEMILEAYPDSQYFEKAQNYVETLVQIDL